MFPINERTKAAEAAVARLLAENTSVALTLFAKLGFEPSRHLSALSRVSWPGRMERIASAPAVYLSGDHNPQGIESLIELLRHYPRRRLHLLMAIGPEKDMDGLLGPLSTLPDTDLHLTETAYKTRRLDEYGPWLAKVSGKWKNPREALAALTAAALPGDMILVSGSLYLVGEIRSSR